METSTATNARPRRSRRASMSCMPAPEDINGAEDLAKGKTKEILYEQYKAEKAARLKAHQDAEAQFRQKTTVQLEETSGLAEQEDAFSTKVELGTFERPKVSRRQRRASMGITLQILDPIEDVKLELEEITNVSMPISPVVSKPVLNADGLFTGGPIPGMWDGSAGADPNVMYGAEALAGWKTVTFEDGPLGMQLEPTVGDKACKVTGFLDTLGCPSQARSSGQIKFDDVIVKVNGKLPQSYEETLEMIAVGGQRMITFRPGFSYELVDLSRSTEMSPGKGKKKKVGRTGRRASMSAVPTSLTKSPTDVSDIDRADKEDCGYGDMGYGEMGYGDGNDMGYGDMGYGDDNDMGYGDAAPSKKHSPKAKKKSHATDDAADKKKSKRGRRASCVAVMPSMPGLVSATDLPKAKEEPKEEEVPKKKVSSKRGRRASMSSMPAGAMPALVSATDVKPAKEAKEEENKAEKKPSSKGKVTCFDALGYEPPSEDMGYGDAEPEKKEKKKSHSKKGRRASIATMPSALQEADSSSKSKMAVIKAMEEAEAAKKDKKKKKKEAEEEEESPKAKKKSSSLESKSKSKSEDKDKDKKKKKEKK